ncbi:hypothetical protein ACT80S_18605 [Ramlibacter sp. MAHUQ-53]|uniref:hypothetical protein n=1 Tax=unclassified Ramlibacter TaxID=2617605 RepID=UPI00363C8947
MSKAKFTRGPWEIGLVVNEETPSTHILSQHDHYDDDDKPVLNGGCDVALCFGSDQAANARLIAAAPELLSALANLLADATALGIEDSPYSGAVAEARAAIAKATGASH